MHRIVTENGKMIRVQVSGKLTQEDYDQLLPRWEALIAREGAMRLLLVMEDFHGWSPGAAWDDLRFEMTHASEVERVAIVGDKSWQKWMIKIGGYFTGDAVQYFDATQLSEAEKWISA